MLTILAPAFSDPVVVLGVKGQHSKISTSLFKQSQGKKIRWSQREGVDNSLEVKEDRA